MPVGARRDGSFYAVTLEPDVCLTPMGAGMVPVPYPLYASFEGSSNCIQSVQLNEDPCFVFDHSLTPTVEGDEPGTGGGVKSGVNKGKVWAHGSSRNVFAEGRRIVRVGDRCWMNAKV